MKKIRTLMVDDHRMFVQSVTALLERESDIEVVATYSEAAAAIKGVRGHQPDVVLLDLTMPGMHGQEAIQRMLEIKPNLGVIVLTMETDELHLLRAVKSGVRGYLLKDSEITDVAKAIRAVGRGEALIDPRLTVRLLREIQSTWEPPEVQYPDGLRARDVEILRLLAHGLSNKEIGAQLGFSEKTIKNYLSLIFQKLSISDRTQAAIYAIRQGLVETSPMVE